MKREASEDAPSLVRGWSRPAGWPLFSVFGFLLAWLLWLGLYPSFYYMTGLAVAFLAWAGTAVVFLLRVMVQLHFLTRHQVPVSGRQLAIRRWSIAFAALLVVTLLLVHKIPLRIGFLTARPALSRLVAEVSTGQLTVMKEDARAGLYTVSAEMTNWRLRGSYDGAPADRIVFVLANDSEAAFIFSPSGIDNLAYNSGSKGHVFGDWYWMKED